MSLSTVVIEFTGGNGYPMCCAEIAEKEREAVHCLHVTGGHRIPQILSHSSPMVQGSARDSRAWSEQNISNIKVQVEPSYWNGSYPSTISLKDRSISYYCRSPLSPLHKTPPSRHEIWSYCQNHPILHISSNVPAICMLVNFRCCNFP
jgi:hypothetical protein